MAAHYTNKRYGALDGLFVEADNFSFGYLATASLDVPLSEVQKNLGGGIDNEFAAIVAIPLDPDTIERLLSDPSGFDPSGLGSAKTLWVAPTPGLWHTSSLTRLALACWLAAIGDSLRRLKKTEICPIATRGR